MTLVKVYFRHKGKLDYKYMHVHSLSKASSNLLWNEPSKSFVSASIVRLPSSKKVVR